MKREIKFRGQNSFSFNWVYGFLSSPETIAIKSLDDYDDIPIIKDTIGQFTALTDKRGVDIYEGDIVIKKEEDWSITDHWEKDDERWNQDNLRLPLKEVNRDYVTLERFGYWLKNEEFGYEGEYLQSPEYYEVIGNIHENQELLNK